jgi:NTP pyrophosphatase (non-canonical NTP hydrolase)
MEPVETTIKNAEAFISSYLTAMEPKRTLNDYAKEVHAANKKWWVDINTGEPLQRNVGEMLMLVVTELAEAMEGYRKNLQDDKLPHRKMFEVELADAVIRIFDIADGLGYDLEGAYQEKMAFNATRKDHTHEARRAANGKKF